MRSRPLFVAMSVLCVAVAAYALVAPRSVRAPCSASPLGSPQPTGQASSAGQSSPAPIPPAVPSDEGTTDARAYDIQPLLRPKRPYLGLAAQGAPTDMKQVTQFAEEVSRRPNIITIYQQFGDPFVASEVRTTFDYGALPILRWEPFDTGLADIARGSQDEYLEKYAASVRRLGLPLAITFAHEMNGQWYPWGSQHNSGRTFVRAWHRIHDIFEEAGATNVIWAWTPNVISGAPGVSLASWFPGDAYVDWIGIDGYIAADGPRTYQALFGPTMKEVQRFSKRPFLIVETGVERGPFRVAALKSLLRGVAGDSRMLGLVYFNQRGSRDWLLDGDSAALAAFAVAAESLDYGFTVR
jgi:mannan endo-1,4-beta-mannosidase